MLDSCPTIYIHFSPSPFTPLFLPDTIQVVYTLAACSSCFASSHSREISLCSFLSAEAPAFPSPASYPRFLFRLNFPDPLCIYCDTFGHLIEIEKSFFFFCLFFLELVSSFGLKEFVARTKKIAMRAKNRSIILLLAVI